MHIKSALSPPEEELELAVAGTRAILQMAREHGTLLHSSVDRCSSIYDTGVPSFVYCSSYCVAMDRSEASKPQRLNEGCKVTNHVSEYARAKVHTSCHLLANNITMEQAKAERLVRSHTSPSMKCVSVRPATVWGRDDTTFAPAIQAAVKRGTQHAFNLTDRSVIRCLTLSQETFHGHRTQEATIYDRLLMFVMLSMVC